MDLRKLGFNILILLTYSLITISPRIFNAFGSTGNITIYFLANKVLATIEISAIILCNIHIFLSESFFLKIT